MSEATMDMAKSRVFEMTADLILRGESVVPMPRGVDWGWGSQEEAENTPERPASQAAEQSQEDSDATAEIDSDDDRDEEPEATQAALETQPPLVTDDKPVEAAKEDKVAALEPKSDEEGDATASSQKLVLEESSEDGSTAEMEPDENEFTMDEGMDDDDSNSSRGKDVILPISRTESQSPKAKRTRRQRKVLVESDSEGEEERARRSPRRCRHSNKAPKRAPAPKEDKNIDNDAESKPSEEEPQENAIAGKQIDKDDLLRSTDFLFVNADKDSVTVSDICHALSAEYACEIPKAMRKIVRERLVDLVKGHAAPQFDAAVDRSQEDMDDEDQVSEQGDEESEQSDFEEPKESDEEYDEARSKLKQARKKNLPAQPKKVATQAKKEPKPNRPSQRNAAKAARMVEAERRRKKRMEELRVRNEEMQLNQSKEEQERAEAIAAKFETNTAESRLKRLEDRLTLLELLDKKRIAVIDALESELEETEAAALVECGKTPEIALEANAEASENSDQESDESSDEEELDIVGAAKPFKPLKPIHTHMRSSALTFLKDSRPNQAKKPELHEVNHVSSRASVMKSVASPTMKKGARGNLREALKLKVRKQGNLWLARELGYKTEEDHLKDCQLAAQQKRSLVLKMEHARIEGNERKLLRERILRQDETNFGSEEEGEEHEGSAQSTEEDEEDEEMQLAKEIENESKSVGVDAGMADSKDVGFKSTDTESWALDRVPDGKEDPRSGLKVDDDRAPKSPEHNDYQERPSELFDTQPPIPYEASGGRKISSESENTVVSTEGKPANVPAVAEFPASTQTGSTSEFAKEEDEGEAEFEEEHEEEAPRSINRPRNAAWQAMLRKEAEKLKRLKRTRIQGLVEDQAEEEEEEEVAGLEDFGFSVKKKKQGDDDDDDDIHDAALDEEDLKHIVDDVSDNEGDEEAGDEARKRQERLEEQERHKEILRRMREGYDGRRGGIAGGGVGARGMHRFDQLVAADNREDAKRLGLLNDDELDSDNEGEKMEGKASDDNEEDEAALLDKILKDRFLHRTDVNLEENFSEDEEDADEAIVQDGGADSDAEEERTQERLAKRFAKRARMQRLEEEFADSQEFSQQRLIDEDESMRQELSRMKNGLVRQRTVSSGTQSSFMSSQESRLSDLKQTTESWITGKTLLDKTGGSLSIALRASRKVQSRTSFLGGDKAGKAKDSGAFIHKSVALSHVVFASANPPSALSNGISIAGQKRKLPGPSTSNLFSKIRKAQ